MDDASGTSLRSQISSVFKHPHKRDLYIALADRWLPRYSEADSNQVELFRKLFSPERQARAARPDGGAGEAETTRTPKVDTSIADYVWLPITFDGDTPQIHWRDEWRIEDFD